MSLILSYFNMVPCFTRLTHSLPMRKFSSNRVPTLVCLPPPAVTQYDIIFRSRPHCHCCRPSFGDFPTNQHYRRKSLIRSGRSPKFCCQKFAHAPLQPPCVGLTDHHLSTSPHSPSCPCSRSDLIFYFPRKIMLQFKQPLFHHVRAILLFLRILMAGPGDSSSSKSIFTNYVTSPLSIENLTGSNYDSWVGDIELWVHGKGYKDHLTTKSDTVVEGRKAEMGT